MRDGDDGSVFCGLLVGEILVSESSPPAFPGETVEPGEEHPGVEGGEPLGGEVVHLLLQVNVLGLGITEIFKRVMTDSD